MLDATAIARYWRFVVKGSETECWQWIGNKLAKDGRGTFWLAPRMITAPRIAWAIANGEMPPDDKFVCHSCDNANCVNPKHLWLGGNQENIQDAANKKRLPGQKLTHCKRGHEFTDENTYRNSTGGRGCRICQRQHRQNYADKNIEKIRAKKRKWWRETGSLARTK